MNSSGNYDFTTLKLDSLSGSRHWVQELRNAGNGNDFPMAFALDDQQNAIVTGQGWDGTDYDFVTEKYDGSTGMPHWAPAVFDSEPDTDSLDVPTAMVVDQWDHVTVTGYCSNGTKAVYATLQYEGVTGAVRWGPVVYSGPRDSVPMAMALDSHGDVFVTGYSEDPHGFDNFVTIKYRGKNGHQIWSALYNVPTPYGSYPVALAVDEEGDVAVTGMVTKPANNTDYVTLKYDGKRGRRLWGPVFYDGKTHQDDSPVAIAADGNGDYLVTGIVKSTLGNRAETVKYEGSTGKLLWIR